MKHRLLCLALCMPLLVGACLRSKPTHLGNQDGVGMVITCLVMDSASSLIPNVKAVFSDGTATDSTGWDGRLRFVPRAKKVKITLSAEGYLKRSFMIDTSNPMQLHILTLPPNPKYDRPNPHRPVHRGGGMVTGVAYKTKTLESAVMYDAVAAPMAEEVMTTATAPKIRVRGATSIYGASAGKLTAGEVNDFAKWYMWDSVLFGTHRQYIDHWKMCFSNRYTAQVLSNMGTPVVNRLVSLTDAKGNTLFQARTDNTGRAELWHDVQTDALFISVDDVRQPAVPFARGLNTIRLDEDCEMVADADVFFIVDATGSMGDEIHYLQAEMKDVIQRSQSAVPGLAIRTGALMYRDHNDEYLTRLSRLSSDIETTQAFVDRQQANGGGDYEEAIPEALMATINTAGWNDEARARIAFLILDAPCHSDSATLALLHEQVLTAAALGIRLVPVVCSGLQGSGELLMRQMALATNGTSFFLTDDSGIGLPHLKPTTDTLKVEHLNDMMVRTIVEFASMPQCADVSAINSDAVEPFLPKPSAATDDPETPVLRADEVLTVHPNPCSVECHYTLLRDVEELYLVDMSGKVMQRLGTQTAGDYTISVASLSVGVYFLSAYCEGRWVTVKVLIK